MIDFETLGQDPSTTVISIGACFFNEDTGEIGPTFYMAFDVDEQIRKGRTITGDTLKWWMGQSNAAKKVFNEKAKPAKEVLTLFSQWVLSQNTISKIRPWGNGSTFDISIIEDMFRMYDVKCPWLYYNVFDLRTFRRYVANGAKVDKSSGVDHNALDDAKNQAKFVIEHKKFFNEMLSAFAQIAQAKPAEGTNAPVQG
jgi:exodeoxyribonuclease VIII